jgi:subtilisin family serine protease
MTAGVAVFATAMLAVTGPAQAQPTAGRFIVTVKDGHDPADVARAVSASPRHIYDSALNGFAATLNDGQLEALRHNPSVRLVERDEIMTAAATQTMDAAGDPWGLDRIDQWWLPLTKTYVYGADATGVRAYILDTGLQANHTEFENRASNAYNATSSWNAADCHGHGTHVAGTVGGKTYGVAKKVYLRGIKVLGADCTKLGWASDVTEGVDWVKANAIKPAVVNISIAGPWNSTLNAAVANLVASGIFVAVAAGNDNVDACTQSPASTSSAFTTAASTKTDAKDPFSNWGSCVDAYAPGNEIRSAALNGGSKLESGTSMASPHVAGTGALLCAWGSQYCTASYIDGWIKSWATQNVIFGNIWGTPNLLLNKMNL